MDIMSFFSPTDLLEFKSNGFKKRIGRVEQRKGGIKCNAVSFLCHAH